MTGPRTTTAPRLYLPIETKIRELDARLLVSAVAAQGHWSVVLGGKGELYSLLQRLKSGIVVEKSIQKGNERKLKRFKAAGHAVCVWCEEGLMFFTAEDYCYRKVGKESYEEVERFFAWGRQHADAVAKVFPQFSAKTVITGNTRLDLTKPVLRGLYDDEVSQIRGEWGDFVLLNTKFARSNYIKRGKGFLEGYIAKGAAPTDEQVRLMTKCVHQEEVVLRHFVDFVARFSAELPAKRLIIRPHPAEDFSLWTRLAEGKSNVSVVHEGNFLAWLTASTVSISNNCTTSVEAFLLGKPGVNFRPFEDEEVEYPLPRAVAYQVPSTDALLQVLASDQPVSNLSLPCGATSEIVSEYIANAGTRFAVDDVLRSLACVPIPSEGTDRLPRRASRAAYGSLKALKGGLQFLERCTSRDSRARHRLRTQKFPGLAPSEVSPRLDRICDLLGLAPVEVTQMGTNVFRVETER